MYELIALREKITSVNMKKEDYPVSNQEKDIYHKDDQEKETMPSEEERDQIKELGSITALSLIHI